MLRHWLFLAAVLIACLAVADSSAQTPVIPGGNGPCQAGNAVYCFQPGNGGYSFQVSTIPAVTAGAYSAGQSVGGLLTFPIGVANDPQGMLQNIYVESKGGSIVRLDIYVWDAKPTHTTCNDNANFVYAQADEKAVVVRTSITPAVIAGGQDTSSSGQSAALWGGFVVSDGTPNLYVCILAHASVTPATTSDYVISISGQKNLP